MDAPHSRLGILQQRKDEVSIYESATTCNHRRRHRYGLSVYPVAAVGWRTVDAGAVPCQCRR